MNTLLRTNNSLLGKIMITKLDNPSIEQLNKILDIWLNVNIEAHHFVDEQYWCDNYEDVQKSLPDAELYVAIENDEIVAFLGLSDSYIAGLFVRNDYRHQGIGGALLETVKQTNSSLKLSVYEKNVAAVNFYITNGFIAQATDVDLKTNEVEFLMVWHQQNHATI